MPIPRRSVPFASLAIDELLPIFKRNISTKLWANRSFWVLLLSRIVAKMSCLCIYYLGRGSSCLGVLGCNGTTTSPQSARFRAGACVSTTLSVIELLFFARDAVERQSRKPSKMRTCVSSVSDYRRVVNDQAENPSALTSGGSRVYFFG